jgi:hypothetical protein
VKEGKRSGKPSRKEQSARPGKRSLYDPKLGARNYRKAEDGRFADHPAFRACKDLGGVVIALEHLATNKRRVNVRLKAIRKQVERALRRLAEASQMNRLGDKVRFAEAIASYFNGKNSHERVVRVCFEMIQLRTQLHEQPSRTELQEAVREKFGIEYSEQEWRRLIKRTGLDAQLSNLPAK